MYKPAWDSTVFKVLIFSRFVKKKDEINMAAINNGSVILNGMWKDLLLMQQEDQMVKQRLGKIIRYHRKIMMYSNLCIKGTLMIFSIVNVGQMVWCSCPGL